jgi:hypothetical protein
VKPKVTRIRNLTFKRGDAVQINKEVPSSLNQKLVRVTNFDDYIIRIVGTSRSLAEKEFASFVDEDSKYWGCLISGSSILSDENPNNSNPVFSAYSLIVAAHVCASSHIGNYNLASLNCQTAVVMDEVFISDFFYAVFQKSKLTVPVRDFDSHFFPSLLANGLILTRDKVKPLPILSSPPVYSGEIKLRPSRRHPDYIYQIVIGLLPYTDNSFLRFFYLYQVIEHLMSEGFKQKYTEVKAKLDSETNMSVTTLRDFLKKLDSSTKEDARIRVVLQPACSITQLCAEQILDALVIDRSEFVFADMVYKIRNVIFHDFPRIHHLAAEVGVFSDNLLRYIVDEKLFVK